MGKQPQRSPRPITRIEFVDTMRKIINCAERAWTDSRTHGGRVGTPMREEDVALFRNDMQRLLDTLKVGE